MRSQRLINRLFGQNGQSLVETVIFLPILIFLLAGIIEISNLLNTQSKITSASRMAAGYGAANVTDPDVANWTDSSTSAAFEMGQIAVNTIVDTLDTDPGLWDIYSIYFEADVEKDDVSGAFSVTYNVFTHTQVYGNGNIVSPTTEWPALVNDIQDDIEQEIQTWPVNADNDRVIGVASVPFHDIDTILGLPIWQWVGMREVQGLTVMRLAELPDNTGCPLLPITVDVDRFSLYPTNWPDFTDLPHNLADEESGNPVTEDMLYPNPYEDKKKKVNVVWDYPLSPPEYEVPSPIMITSTVPFSVTFVGPDLGFTVNVPGIHIDDAKIGYIYLAREEGLSGDFGWLDWNQLDGGVSATDLIESLTPPGGNFTDMYPPAITSSYATIIGDEGGTWDFSPYGTPGDGEGWHVCFEDPQDPGDCDDRLENGEWISTSTGGMSSIEVRNSIKYYVDTKKPVAVLVYDDIWVQGGGGAQAWYRVHDIVKAKFLGYLWTGGPVEERFIAFQYWGPADDCFGVTPDTGEGYPSP